MISPYDYGLRGLSRRLNGPPSLQRKNRALGLKGLQQPPRQRSPFAGGPYDMSKSEQRMRGYVGGMGLGGLR